jgi:hypothetical protein
MGKVKSEKDELPLSKGGLRGMFKALILNTPLNFPESFRGSKNEPLDRGEYCLLPFHFCVLPFHLRVNRFTPHLFVGIAFLGVLAAYIRSFTSFECS